MKTVGITQDQVAERMDLTQGGLSHWLNGRRAINLEDFFRLCDAARADPQAILFESGSVAAIAQLQGLLAQNPGLRDFIARVPDRSISKRTVQKVKRYGKK